MKPRQWSANVTITVPFTAGETVTAPNRREARRLIVAAACEREIIDWEGEHVELEPGDIEIDELELEDAPDHVADEFIRRIRERLTPAQVVLVDEVNRARNNQSCATHDFCDANMVMDAAMRAVLGRPIDTDEADMAVFSEAWSIAKLRGFAS